MISACRNWLLPDYCTDHQLPYCASSRDLLQNLTGRSVECVHCKRRFPFSIGLEVDCPGLASKLSFQQLELLVILLFLKQLGPSVVSARYMVALLRCWEWGSSYFLGVRDEVLIEMESAVLASAKERPWCREWSHAPGLSLNGGSFPGGCQDIFSSFY
jgi:hypothetical protein